MQAFAINHLRTHRLTFCLLCALYYSSPAPNHLIITPNEGLQDVYLSVGAKFDGIKLLAIYHDFTSDEDNLSGEDDLGSELGFLALREFGDYTVSIKYANYESGDSSFNKSDTEKLWLTVSGTF